MLGATGHREWRKKHGASGVSKNNLVCGGFGTIGLIQMGSMEQFMVLSFLFMYVFIYFYIWILVTIHFSCLEDYCNAFFLWDSSCVLWTQKVLLAFYWQEGIKGIKLITQYIYVWRKSIYCVSPAKTGLLKYM